jgi:uncharacterized membrane protein YGL010W
VSEAQLDDYARRHRDGLNLLVHLVTVPLFALGVGVGVAALVHREPVLVSLCVALVVYSLLMQRWGHRREQIAARRQRKAADALARFLHEQFVLFPRFVLSGRWRENYEAAQK